MSEDDAIDKLAVMGVDVASGGVISTVSGVLSSLGMESAAARMDRAIAEGHAEWMEERIRDLEEKFTAARKAGADVRSTDARAIAEGIDRAFRTTADPGKRKLLEHAASRAFDPDVYEAGLTLVLLDILERLTYGDVVALRKLLLIDLGQPGRSKGLAKTGSIDSFHERRLSDAGLAALLSGSTPAYPVVSRPGPSAVRITELGRRMLRLLRGTSEPEPEVGADDP